jgi:putative transposase
LRPALVNETWSMDFVFDRVASGRSLKCLTVVDDATHEAIALPVEHAMGGEHLTRVLDAVCSLRGKPQVNPDGDGPVTGRATMMGRIGRGSSCG